MPSTNRTAILVHFDEPTGIPPTDAAGALLDLTAPAGLTAPVRADGAVGGARQWAAGNGLAALERTTDATKLRRSMAIEAVIELAATDGARVIAQRGANTGTAAERILWGLKLTRAYPNATLQMFWQKASGAAATIAGATFVIPAGALYLVAVRRWVSATSVTVDYYVNEIPVGSATSADGDIDGGDGGTTYIGTTDAAGVAVAGLLPGDLLDELRVSADERTTEELRQVYRRLFVFPTWGQDAVRSLLPQDVYSPDPSSRVQRNFALVGDAIAGAWALADELEDDFLPDRATRTLDRWEAVTRLSPGPLDTYAQRRARVLGFLRKIHGYTKDNIVKAVAGLLQLSEANVLIVENHHDAADPTQVYQWYVYRNPALAGTPDIIGAQLVLDGMRPAHTRGSVVQSLSMLCDDPYSLTDRDPLGI